MGFVVGAVAGFVLAYFAGEVLVHDFQTGLLPGAALALWIGSAINHDAKEEKLNLLFPIPLKYEVPVKQAFAKVKKVIREFSYDYGTTFRIHPTNPSQERKILADMTWTDIDEVAEPTQHDFGRTRKEPVKRHIRLEIYFRSPDQNSTVVEIRWYPKAEGLNPRACEPILRKVNAEIEAALGEGTTDLPPKQPWIPPVWLHIATIACIGLYILTASSQIDNLWAKANDLEEKARKEDKRWADELEKLETAKRQWDAFKKSYKPPVPRSRYFNFGKPQPPPTIVNPNNYQGLFNFSKPKNKKEKVVPLRGSSFDYLLKQNSRGNSK